MRDKFVITFAGAMGSGKTPIACYLSWKLGLPVFSNDSIRAEVAGDLETFLQEEYLKRRDARLGELVARGKSFIYDASVDREWEKFEEQALSCGYAVFLISLDLSPEFLLSLHAKKEAFYQCASSYVESIGKFVDEHAAFLARYGNEVGLHIDDRNFSSRMELSCARAREWIEDEEMEVA